MILIVSPSGRGPDCARLLEQVTSLGTRSAASAHEAAGLLRVQEYSAVIFDQLLLDAEPDEAELLLEHIGSATPIYVNFAIHGMERVARQVRFALQRRSAEERGARLSAQRLLRSELNETVTAMLLSCDMALTLRDLPTAAVEKLQSLHDLARELSVRLGDRPAPS